MARARTGLLLVTLTAGAMMPGVGPPAMAWHGAVAGQGAVSRHIHLVQTDAAEISFWESVKYSRNPAELQAYLDAYPQGAFAPLARIRLSALKPPDKAAAPAAPARPPARKTETQTQTETGTATSSKPAPDDRRAEIPPMPPALAHHGVIGVELAQVNTAGSAGVLLRVVRIQDYGTARNRGLRAGDVIVEAFGRPVLSMLQFVQDIRATPPGKTIELGVRRGGARLTVLLPVGDRLERYWSAAHGGDAEAMAYLGMSYRAGDIVARDYGQARAWLEKSAGAGFAGAHNELALMYSIGQGVETNHARAFDHALKSAGMGDRIGQFNVGFLYGTGQGVAKSDVEAVRWYRKAAEQGHRDAMHNLAWRFLFGTGVAKNEHEAAAWFEKAIEAGHVGALSGLGSMYKTGAGGKPKDLARAVSLFRQGAEKGDASGRYNLGLMYEFGEGVLKDRNEALRLYRLAARGDSRAATRLEQLKEPLYDAAEIQRLLDDLGFDPGLIDGKPGRKTRQAISDYQRKAGLNVTGAPSVDLLEHLRKAKAGGTPSPAARASTPSAGAADDLSELNSLD